MLALKRYISPIRRELLRFSTAGNVDNGKSTLLGRLLYDSNSLYSDLHSQAVVHGAAGEVFDFSRLVDGLRAERELGITIDVAYRYFATAKRSFILADAPGHREFTRNMATAASTADVAIVLLDATRPITAQSKRHACIAALFGIRHLIIAVNKMDAVEYDADVFGERVDCFSDFLQRLEIGDIRFIPVSALCGDNIVNRSAHMPWYNGTTLLDALETTHIASDRNHIDVRLPLQLQLPGRGTNSHYYASVSSGILRQGAELIALPQMVPVPITALFGPDGEISEAYPGAAISFATSSQHSLKRGDLLAPERNLPHVSNSVDCMLLWMDEHAFSPSRHFRIFCSSRTVPVTISEIIYQLDIEHLQRRQKESLELNDIVRARLTTTEPIFIDSYRRNRATGCFILLDEETHATAAAGIVLDQRSNAQLFSE